MNWIVNGVVVFYCGDFWREIRMVESFNRLWLGGWKVGNENEKKIKKCMLDVSYLGKLFWGVECNRVEKI